MAKEKTDGEGGKVVKAEISEWNLKQEERALFGRADDVPNWRLADKVRRMLADLNFHFSEQMPETVGLEIKEIDPTVACRSAIIAAGAIAVRAAGSVMALIASGYGPEAAGPMRRLLEAKLNVQALLDDTSGQYAIRYLQGQPRGLAKLAQKYGNEEEVKLMSVLTHADVRGLSMLYVGAPERSAEVIEGTFSLMPFRDEAEAEYLLHALAYECALICAGLAQAFEVAFEIPPWISGELQRLRDKAQQRQAQREDEKTQAMSRAAPSKRSRSAAARQGPGRRSRRKR